MPTTGVGARSGRWVRVAATLAITAGLSVPALPTVAAAATGRAVTATTKPSSKVSTPAKTQCAKPYVVKNGDFWVRIATTYSVTLKALLAANKATQSTPLYPGSVVCLPDSAVEPTSTTPAPGTPAPTTGTTTTTGPAPTTTGPGGATPTGATTPTGEAAVVVPIQAFPVQGPCWYADTWGAARSGGRKHEGVDLIAKAGNYIYAAVDGTLTKRAISKPGSLSGNAWWLTGKDGTYFFYAHLSAFAPDLQVGSKVVAGQVIGWVGATGDAAGPHLHFEVHPGGGKAVDPTPTVKAIDACKQHTPLPQPSGTLPPAPAVTSPPGNPSSSSDGTTGTTPTSTPTGGSIALPNSAPPTVTAGTLWQFVNPVTAYDTQTAGARLAAGTPKAIDLGGIAGVPAGVDGVMLRFTTRGASRSGYLVAHRCDVAAPATAMLTFPGGGWAVGTAVAAVTGGKVCVTANASLNVRVEVIAVRAANGVGLQPVAPTRALDTRTAGRLAKGGSVTIPAAALGVSAGTQAISATVTIVSASSAGSLSIGPCGGSGFAIPFPTAAIWSVSITVRASSGGWCVTSSAPTDVVVDVTGRWAGTSASPAPIDPSRVFDSRATGAKVGTSFVPVAVAGHGNVPGGATTALLAVSVIGGRQPGIVFAMPCGAPRAEGALAATPAWIITTSVVPVALDGGGICLSALTPVDVVVDVVAAS